MKQKTIKQTGFIISGYSTLNCWGGGNGTVEMESYFLPFEKTTPKNILRCVNDNGFGCKSIESAQIDIYIKYDNGCIEFNRSLFIDNPVHSQFFLGWSDLRKQGITC